MRGSWRIAQPSASRWRHPPARSLARVFSRPDKPGHLDDELHARRDLVVAQAVQRAEEPDVLLDRQRLVQRELLRHVADAPLHFFRIAAHVDAIDHRRSRRRLQQPAHHADGRRLAGAVRAEKSEDLSALDGEADAIDGGERAELAREIAHEDRAVVPSSPQRPLEARAGELRRSRARA